jgi:hypothetical protein
MRTVRPAKGIAWRSLQFILHSLDIIRRQHGVRIQDQYIFALSPLHAIVAALSGARIGLHIIMYVQAVSILLDHIFAGHRRAVLYHYDFKILQTLLGQTLQQFVDLVGSIVYGYNHRILHNCEISKR